jgi:hypothetical protein
MQESLDLLRFRRCRDLHGNILNVTVGKRNGKPAVFIRPSLEDPDPAPEPRGLIDQERLFVNLNPVERETWRKLLAAQSVASIAQEEGVSRNAIYARIKGNTQGQGGMIAKNYWVLLWWRLRRRLFTSSNL